MGFFYMSTLKLCLNGSRLVIPELRVTEERAFNDRFTHIVAWSKMKHPPCPRRFFSAFYDIDVVIRKLSPKPKNPHRVSKRLPIGPNTQVILIKGRQGISMWLSRHTENGTENMVRSCVRRMGDATDERVEGPLSHRSIISSTSESPVVFFICWKVSS